MGQINLGSGPQGSPPTEEQKQLIRDALDISTFTVFEREKLQGIEVGADVTDTENVIAALTAGNNITISADGTISSTDTTLSDEQIQDIIGAMVTGNTESGISVIYDDESGSIIFSVDSQTDENFTTADHAKLDGIEPGATADQTDAEIKTAYENNANTNAFTDADLSKLAGIEPGATADQTASEIRTLVDSATDSNVFTDADLSKLTGIEAGADVTPTWVPSVDPNYATQTYVNTEVSNLVDSAPETLDTLNELASALNDDPNFATTISNTIGTKLPLSGGTMTGNITMAGTETVDGRDLSVDGAKLDGIEAGATADQTADEIRTLVDSATDSNVFTDADHAKLDGLGSLDSGGDTNITGLVIGDGSTLAAATISEVRDAAGFDPGDFATAAQGSLADSALQSGDIDTLAELNAIVTDATLIDTTDSRLSDARTPTAHSHTLSNITDAGTAAANDTSDFEAAGTVSTHAAITSGVHGISTFGASLIDDADAATARTTLGVDAAGTDNSTSVTLAGSLDYLSLSGQEITLGSVDLTTDVTGTLPAANGGTGVTALTSLNLNTLGSGAATDGYVATADGSGGVAWEAASGGGISTGKAIAMAIVFG